MIYMAAGQVWRWIYVLIFTCLVIVAIQRSTTNQGISSTDEILRTLSRQAARWSLAAEQDRSLLVGLLHANYGAGYLWSMLDIATPSRIEAATGIDFVKFRKRIVSIQDDITRRIVRKYPEFAGEPDLFLSQIAGKA